MKIGFVKFFFGIIYCLLYSDSLFEFILVTIKFIEYPFPILQLLTYIYLGSSLVVKSLVIVNKKIIQGEKDA
jgi:hypothetical protein